MRKNYLQKYKLIGAISILFLAITGLAACGSSSSGEDSLIVVTVAPQNSANETEGDAGYPAPDQTDGSGYPAPQPQIEGLLAEPPTANVELPEMQPGKAVVGGYLVQEYPEQGFLPLEPVRLTLASMLLTENGQPAYIRESDDSPSAKLLPTGIFIFENISPDTYALVVDVGYVKFPILDEGTDEIKLIEVKEGDVIDLGQIITVLP